MVVSDPEHAKPEVRLARISARQHGLVTRRQAMAVGLSAEMIKTRLRNGTLVPVLRGVYRLPGVRRTWKQDVLAVVLWGGDKAVASHGTAAKLWGFAVSPSAIEITVPVRRQAPKGSIKIHRGAIAANDTIDFIPVTTPTRTLLDIANRVDRPVLEALVDDAIAHKLATRTMLEWELSMTGGSGRYGSHALRQALDHLADGHAESLLESKVLRILLAAGLPMPARQYEIRSNGVLIARVDLAYSSVRLAIEVDGYEFHSSRKAFDDDRRRDARLATMGWQVIRATSAVTRDSSDFIAAVRRRIEATLF